MAPQTAVTADQGSIKHATEHLIWHVAHSHAPALQASKQCPNRACTSA